ncbi:hypothetical protein MNBD_BACTEROID05-994 [hydrothermal vent metagenome]|uniref:Uncharacterized protein n=1 Tax=hydrothermal vent metagenome TaxID=652676 RepID=A0A3B0THA7_9ZZZZ
MAEQFYISVFDYAELVLFVQAKMKKIPEIEEEIEIDFNDPNTIFIEGVWGEDDEMSGVFSFTVQKHSQAVEEYNGLPVVECQLAHEEL